MKEYKGMEWVSIKDELPEPLVDVLCTYDDGSSPKIVDRGWMFHSGEWTYEEIYGKVTHWMPMPEPAED